MKTLRVLTTLLLAGLLALPLGAATGITYGLRTNVANGASTNNVNFGALSGVDWTTFTVGGWWLPITVTVNNRMFWSKGTNAGARVHALQSNGASGEITVRWSRAVSQALYVSTAGGWVRQGQPICLFVTGDQSGAAGNIMKVYVGDLSTPLTQIAMAGAGTTDGSGAFSSIAAGVFRLNSSEVPDTALSGVAFVVAVAENRTLSLDQMNLWKQNYQAGRGMQLSLVSRAGANGTGRVIDESGHNFHGTITGAFPFSAALPGIAGVQRWSF